MHHNVDADANMPLLWAVRDLLGLHGTKFGCGVGACGACTVDLDGVAVRSCVTSLADVQGKSVTTIKGLGKGGEHVVQRAWKAANVPQCGYYRVIAQFEGAVVMALGNTLYSELTCSQGAVEQSNFTDCRVARRDSVPETHVYIVPSAAPPGGVGEPGVPPTTAAICNAIFNVTGTRIRALPVDSALLKRA